MKKRALSALVLTVATTSLVAYGIQQASAAPRTLSTTTSTQVSSPDSTSPVAPYNGVLQGHLYGAGGMSPGTKVPWAGTITVTGMGIHREITVAEDGAYLLPLAPGTYTVEGHSPDHLGPAPCPATGEAVIDSGRTTTIDAICPIP